MINAVIRCKVMGLNTAEALAYLRSQGHEITEEYYIQLRKDASRQALQRLDEVAAGMPEAHLACIAELQMIREEFWRTYRAIRRAPKPGTPEAEGMDAAALAAWDRKAVEQRGRILVQIRNTVPYITAFTEAAGICVRITEEHKHAAGAPSCPAPTGPDTPAPNIEAGAPSCPPGPFGPQPLTRRVIGQRGQMPAGRAVDQAGGGAG